MYEQGSSILLPVVFWDDEVITGRRAGDESDKS
jgi:hypothetical protein